MIFFDLIQNIALLVTLVVAHRVILRHSNQNTIKYKILSGLLFGGTGVVGMMTPYTFGPGILIDGRSIILSVAGLFGGLTVAVPAAFICFVYSLLAQGAGLLINTSFIIESATLGIVFCYLRKRHKSLNRPFALWRFGLLIHVIMLALFPAFAGNEGWKVLQFVGLPVLIVFPVAVMLVGQLFLDYEEQARNKTSLQQTERFISTLLDDMLEGCQIVGFDWRYLYVNQTVVKHARVPKERLLGKRMHDVFPGIQNLELFDALRRCMEERKPERLENEFAYADGHTRWFDLRISPVPEGIFILSVDITERKQTENALKQSERRLATLMDNIPGMAYRCENNTNWTMLFVSKGCSALTGYMPEDLIDDKVISYSDLIHPEDRQKVWDGVESALRKKEPFQFIYRIIAANREEKWVWEQGQGIFDTDGNLLNLEGLIIDISNQKQAEEALVKSERRYRKAIEVTGAVPYYQNYLTSEYEFVGNEIETLLGCRPDEFTPQLWRSSIKELVLTGALADIPYEEALERARNTEGIIWTANCRVQTRQGQERWIANSAIQIRDNKRQIIGSLGTLQDITEQKLAEEALRESQERLKIALKASNVGLWDWDIKTNQVHLSIECKKQIGYEDDEIGTDVEEWKKYYHPDDLAQTLQTIEDRLAGERHDYQVEFRLRHKDGSYRWILSQGDVIKDENGTPVRMLGCHVDITEKKQAEEERERLMLAIEQAGEIVMITDIDGIIQYVNPMFEQITGYSREEAIGRNPRFLKSGEHDDSFYHELWRTLKRGETWTGRLIDKKKDETLFTQYAVFSPVHNALNQTISYVAVMRDITKEIHLENQLQQAQKMESIGRLAGGVAHDSNNMMQVILGYAELGTHDLPENSPLYSLLSEIQRAAERTADLNRQLLAFARKQTVIPKVINLNDSISSMLTMLQRLISEEIELVWKPGHDLWNVKIDPSQLDQILANLVVNARDAISGVGKIVVETANVKFDDDYCKMHSGYRPGNYVMLALSDNGCGMDKETQSNIFEPFFTTKGIGKGTGLGLSTVYGAVKQNDGFLNIYSELGNGTTFRIYLPQFGTQKIETTEVHAQHPLHKGVETILIVEDDKTILRLATGMLESLGYAVITANTPADAIRQAKEYDKTIDLLLTDIVMPEMGGAELAKQLHSARPGIKCLFMSGYTADAIADNGIVQDGTCFLPKPFSIQELDEKVREVLEQT